MALSQYSGQVATAAVNEVTGNRLVSKSPSEEYKAGWDRIFGKKDEVGAEPQDEAPPEPTE